MDKLGLVMSILSDDYNRYFTRLSSEKAEYLSLDDRDRYLFVCGELFLLERLKISLESIDKVIVKESD